MNLLISYSVWKTLAQNHTSWVTYYLVDSSSRDIWTGDRDHVYQSRVDEEDLADWQANFESGSTAVLQSDDAIAQIVGLTGINPKPLALDGTPLYGKQQLALGQSVFQRTDDATEDMAINGTSNSTTIIWNGTGVNDVGGDWTHQAQGVETAGSMHSGTNGMDSGVRNAGQDTRFDYGSNQDIAGIYDSVSFWMQPKAFPSGAELKIRFKTSGGSNPGNHLKVNNYVTGFDLDVWQKVTIPIVDFALGANVAKLEFTYAKKGGQHFYFDDIELNSNGIGPKTFRVQPPTGFIWHVETLAIVIAAGDAGWDSNAFANITGGLANGLLLQYKNIGASPETYWSINSKNNTELFGQFEVTNNIEFEDDDLMVAFALKTNLSSVVLVDNDNVLDILVRDNLSTLSKARAFLHYGVEALPA